MTGLKNKIAIVTGHRGGIGGAIADVLGQEGAIVEGLDLPDVDLADPDAIKRAADDVIARHGGVDILVNNAGVTTLGTILDTPLDELNRVFAVNFTAPYLLIQAVLPSMIERGGGAVVNVASDQALIGKRYSAAYGASKAALAQLTKSAALDWAKAGIRFNCVAPGSTDSAMLHEVTATLQRRWPDLFPAGADEAYRDAVPMGRLANPLEIARAVSFLASDAASFITGAVIPVDGGGTA